jgi:hypothetical protein
MEKNSLTAHFFSSPEEFQAWLGVNPIQRGEDFKFLMASASTPKTKNHIGIFVLRGRKAEKPGNYGSRYSGFTKMVEFFHSSDDSLEDQNILKTMDEVNELLKNLREDMTISDVEISFSMSAHDSAFFGSYVDFDIAVTYPKVPKGLL